MRRVILSALDVEERVEQIRLNLAKSIGQNKDASKSLREIFEKIDFMNRGLITEREISSCLQSYPSPEQLYDDQRGVFKSEEIQSLILRFNKDKHNGRISMPEFVNELTLKIV